MKTFVDELWNGEIGKKAVKKTYDKDENALYKEVRQYEKIIASKLDGEPAALFEEYLELRYELDQVCDRRVFEYGLRIGKKIAYVMTDEEDD